MEVPNEIMVRYIERRKRDLEECLVSIEEDNFSVLERVGHQLKGNGSTFGYPELSTIGKDLEIAARCHDHDSLKKALDEFSEWVNTAH